MADIGQKGRLAYAVGVGLFGVALAAGIVESLRVEGRLPAIDQVLNGPKASIDRLRARRDYDGAIDQLEMQARILPDDAGTHEELAKLLDKRGRPEEAQVHFHELVRLRPDDAQAYYFLGFTYLETNQPHLAKGCFSEAIHLKPRYAEAYNGLGTAWGHLGEMAQAEECFAKAVELAPDFGDAKNNLEKTRALIKSGPNGAKKKED